MSKCSQRCNLVCVCACVCFFSTCFQRSERKARSSKITLLPFAAPAFLLALGLGFTLKPVFDRSGNVSFVVMIIHASSTCRGAYAICDNFYSAFAFHNLCLSTNFACARLCCLFLLKYFMFSPDVHNTMR